MKIGNATDKDWLSGGNSAASSVNSTSVWLERFSILSDRQIGLALADMVARPVALRQMRMKRAADMLAARTFSVE
jgi:hypothetical protein